MPYVPGNVFVDIKIIVMYQYVFEMLYNLPNNARFERDGLLDLLGLGFYIVTALTSVLKDP